jgi:outer membrane autotransporter protein
VATLSLDTDSALHAFDLLSGEVHADAKSVVLNAGADLQETIDDRLSEAPGEETVSPTQFTLNLAPGGTDCTVTLCAIGDRPALAAWGRALGSWSDFDGNGNAAGTQGATGGFLSGVDATFAGKWRLGVAAGYSHTGIDVDARNATAGIDSYHLAAYGGVKAGRFNARLGAAYTFHEIDSERKVDFPGFTETERAHYSARTAQVYGEAGVDLPLGRMVFQPLAGVSYINLDTDGFDEGDGAAALKSNGSDQDIVFSTAGLRATFAATAFGAPLRLEGMLGWRHAFGDVTPKSTMSFSNGSADFTVQGVPISRNSALVELRSAADVTDALTLGLSYSGQFAGDARQHGVRADVRLRF